jgi:hypothetical protein
MWSRVALIELANQLEEQEFGTPELNAAMYAHGYGSHPELIRLLARIGKALNDARGEW